MVPLIEREVVDGAHWMERKEYYQTILLTQSVPGPIAVNTALVVGLRIGGPVGAFVSALGVILPSFTIILLIAMSFASFHSIPVVEAVFRGVRATVVALIAAAAVRLAREKVDFFTIVLAVAGLAALIVLSISPFVLVLVYITLGLLKGYIDHRRTQS